MPLPWYRPSWALWSYIVSEFSGPLVMSLIVIMFVFLLQFLMRFIDKIVGKGLDLWTIVQLIAYNLAWMVVLAVPMAVLVGCVMAFGSLSSTKEIVAMKAAGVSLGRMIFPLLVIGIGLSFFDLQFNNKILPDANHLAKDLMSDIQRKKPTFAIEPGRFSEEDAIPGYSILAQRTVPGTSDLESVTIYDHSQPNETRVLTAERAKVAFTRDFRNIVLTLFTGEFHQYNLAQPTEYRRGKFSSYVVQVPTSGFDFMRQGESERSDRELSAQDLMRSVRSRDTTRMNRYAGLREHLLSFSREVLSSKIPIQYGTDSLPASDRPRELKTIYDSRHLTIVNDESSIRGLGQEIDAFMVEVHKKYAIPVACIVFVLLGVPMGALARRGGIGVGVGFSIGFFVLYWIFLIGGEKLADRGVIEPWTGMWGGNILLGVLGIYLTWRVASERPGLQIWGRIGRFLTSWRKARKPVAELS